MAALIFAFIAPLLWALMNILDKYVVSRKAKGPLSYGVVAAFAQLILASIVSLFLDWKGVESTGILFSALAGVFLGFQFFSYFMLLRTEDSSDVAGLGYIYPIIVAMLAFIFLGEKLHWSSYFAIVLIIVGAVFLSSKWPELRGKRLLLLVHPIISIALTEFMMKLASQHVGEWQGMVISSIALAVTVMIPLLIVTAIRRRIRAEIRNIRFAIPIESLTLAAMLVTYLAMVGISVTVVSAIGAAQPLFVLGLEAIVNRNGGHITKHKLRKKILPILMIVIGVALLYLMQR
jgi:drug/metabolite transporter (DMT)-like permease